MDTRTPRRAAKQSSPKARPQVVRLALLTGPTAAREFRRLVSNIHGEMRRRGMSDKNVKELRKWLRDA